MDPETQKRLEIVRRQYFQLVEPSQLRWSAGSVLKAPSVQSWIYDNLFNSDKISSLPPDRYQLRVLKFLTALVERAIDDPEEDEISDELMSKLSSLLSSNLPSESASAQQKAYVTYSYSLQSANQDDHHDRAVTLLESRSVISSAGTTGLRTWEAALVLGEFLSSKEGQDMVQGKNVLELGAGTGILSILCAKYLRVSHVVATDGDEAVVDAIKTNIFLNGLDKDDSSLPIISTAALRWGSPVNRPSFEEDYGMPVPDVLLGADVTYDKSVIPRLVSSLSWFFELNPFLQVIICATVRNEQTVETFQNACNRNRFLLEDVDFAPMPEELQTGPFYPTGTRIRIWRITRTQPSPDSYSF
ncbi:hypothetical protein GQ43DRAFT_362745 [Delitschia confertaspora ATCC 74209]|uniref:Methyltransferase small domain protein n=1 Tax=Delitschia confertaspora ATCC 74209 TaxID=1513339 RepID=A0A9P4JTI3_9PLEO|nr:hypothetical protein GQ43DRAFT_362745 [Delitschia confertaspora ATCC 74209]